MLPGQSLMQIHYNQFKTNHYFADILNYLFNIKIYGLCDNILKDDDSNLFMVFINVSILFAEAYVSDSSQEETNNSASNTATIISKVIGDSFDCAY